MIKLYLFNKEKRPINKFNAYLDYFNDAEIVKTYNLITNLFK